MSIYISRVILVYSKKHVSSSRITSLSLSYIFLVLFDDVIDQTKINRLLRAKVRVSGHDASQLFVILPGVFRDERRLRLGVSVQLDGLQLNLDRSTAQTTQRLR